MTPPVLHLALRSASARRGTLALVLAAIALSALLLLGVERLQAAARDSFAQSISGTDLVVGGRTGSLQLMLASVFRLGEATSSISWVSAQWLAAQPGVAWTIPISLGDSLRGFPVVGTSTAYFEHFRYGDREPLEFATGKPFAEVFDAVLGSEVAARLDLSVGSRVVLAHGAGLGPGLQHGDKPFTVTGVLAATGTPVDRSVHVSLAGIEAIHLEWEAGAPIPGVAIPPEFVRKFDLTPKQVSAVLVGLKQRAAVFNLQRRINSHPDEPLLAVLPGVALGELWQLVGAGQRAVQAISALVAVVSLMGMLAVILAGLNERRRELAVLRSVGARPRDVFALLAIEGAGVALAGALLGWLLVNLAIALLGPWAQAHYGLALRWAAPTPAELQQLAGLVFAGTVISPLPGWRAYRLSLADGLSPRT
jgi:putative ABC transport system permease protein